MPDKLKIIIVDKDRNTVITDMDQWLFKRLNITAKDVKPHKSHSSLNKEIIEFIKNFGND